LRDEVKFPPEQAEKAASVLADTFADWQGQQQHATREDIQSLEQKLHLLIEQKAADTLKWVFGMTLAQSGFLYAIVKLHG
jgi:hypothetical protein